MARARLPQSRRLVFEDPRLRRIAQVFQASSAVGDPSCAEAATRAIVLFNEGLAYIGLGNIKAGEKLAEGARSHDAIAGRQSPGCQGVCCANMRNALEHAGYLMMAIQAYHRYDAVGEKIMTGTRQRAFLELSAKFDDERKARELELLRRDNALKASEMRGQRLQQQLILAAAVFVTFICAALLWAFARVRRANDRLRFNSERDALDGTSQSPLLQRARAERRRWAPGRRLRAAGGSRSFQTDQRYTGTSGRRRRARHREPPTVRRIAGDDKLVRWGGEEFLAVLDPITPEQADRRWRDCCKRCAATRCCGTGRRSGAPYPSVTHVFRCRGRRRRFHWKARSA